MYIIIVLILLLFVLVASFLLYSKIREKLNFYVTGLDNGFSLGDLNLLWKVSQLCNLEQPTALFYSIQSLSRCMNQITTQSVADGTNNTPKTQQLISKLFDYRTKIQNKADDKKGLDSTRGLSEGQKLSVIFPGRGVFLSEIVNNGKNIVISVPRRNNLIPFDTQEWVGHTINVYLWRAGDARYVFDSTVLDKAVFLGKPVLLLQQTENLLRTQKRKAVRAKCDMEAQLFIIKEKTTNYDTIETKNGYKCRIEDISESGALVRIGGKGVANIQMKLQFTINKMLIVMFGEIRNVEFNEEQNQSLLHFECTHLNPVMRNEILSFVYQILPDHDKEIMDALTMVGEDEKNTQEGNSQNPSETDETKKTDETVADGTNAENTASDSQLNGNPTQGIAAENKAAAETASDNNENKPVEEKTLSELLKEKTTEKASSQMTQESTDAII